MLSLYSSSYAKLLPNSSNTGMVSLLTHCHNIPYNKITEDSFRV